MQQGWRFELSEGSMTSTRGRSFGRRRRDRRGRGLRGRIMVPPLPGARTRAEHFDDLVVESADRLQDIWGGSLDRVQFAVDEIPGALEELVALGQPAPMASLRPAEANGPATITVYRRPIAQITDSDEEMREVVHDSVVEQVAVLLNLTPESVDPTYGRTRRF
ncbi:metallopeptidase family protein [Arthrobacter russicus]|uniref:Zn-dependent protease with MMP-like domain n=1 Tax=Arthrobacter russicus TaxID=172040 RepID=A0ABU1J9F2_9MICC|nr:metallopeptidase family protein [Arthrobacter russicus]MDR6269045.1 putative Zn-dependent protease with MMP-like domain [Arthrobacter russicus]